MQKSSHLLQHCESRRRTMSWLSKLLKNLTWWWLHWRELSLSMRSFICITKLPLISIATSSSESSHDAPLRLNFLHLSTGSNRSDALQPSVSIPRVGTSGPPLSMLMQVVGQHILVLIDWGNENTLDVINWMTGRWAKVSHPDPCRLRTPQTDTSVFFRPTIGPGNSMIEF